MRIVIIIILLSFFQIQQSTSQNIIRTFFSISTPEKIWVITHPFIAKKVHIISLDAKAQAKILITDSVFFGTGNGDKIDAFRHAFWMARLSQEVHWRKVYKLGVAHEKGNYKDFKKHKLEDGALPDSISSEMDFLNNDAGRQIGVENKKLTKPELILFIRNEIINGNLWVIKQNEKGEFINNNNQIINIDNYKGKWSNPKLLVRSDYFLKSVNK